MPLSRHVWSRVKLSSFNLLGYLDGNLDCSLDGYCVRAGNVLEVKLQATVQAGGILIPSTRVIQNALLHSSIFLQFFYLASLSVALIRSPLGRHFVNKS